MSEILSLEDKVGEIVHQIREISWDAGASSVWLKFGDTCLPEEDLDRILTLLSGFYTSKSIERPFSTLDNLRVEPNNKFMRQSVGSQYLVEYTLVSDFPNKGHGGSSEVSGRKDLHLCYFRIRRVGNKNWDYMITFSRRGNNFARAYHQNRDLSVREASGFYYFVGQHAGNH